MIRECRVKVGIEALRFFQFFLHIVPPFFAIKTFPYVEGRSGWVRRNISKGRHQCIDGDLEYKTLWLLLMQWTLFIIIFVTDCHAFVHKPGKAVVVFSNILIITKTNYVLKTLNRIHLLWNKLINLQPSLKSYWQCIAIKYICNPHIGQCWWNISTSHYSTATSPLLLLHQLQSPGLPGSGDVNGGMGEVGERGEWSGRRGSGTSTAGSKSTPGSRASM